LPKNRVKTRLISIFTQKRALYTPNLGKKFSWRFSHRPVDVDYV